MTYNEIIKFFTIFAITYLKQQRMKRFKGIQIFIGIAMSALFLIATIGCSHKQKNDARLTNIAAIASDQPEEALNMLDSINSNALSEHDRHFYDFLTIKAKDKAFIPHESDSIILDVMKYYESNSDVQVYNEVLYYVGRVYSDIGDYPTALQYYQNALDNIELTSDNSDLRSRICSQTVALLSKLRLYNEAIPYNYEMLEQATKAHDSVSIVHAQRSFGSTYYDLGTMEESDSARTRYLNLADSMLTEALYTTTNFPRDFLAETRVLLAGVKEAKGDLTSALTIVRHTPDLVSRHSRNFALAFAADIYREAGIMDTAFMYAHELVISEDLSNKKTGYRIILSPEFRQMLHPDTLNRYYSEYKNILEDYFDDNRNELSLMQEAQYNYSIHEREKEKTVKDNERLTWAIVCIAILSLILVIILLYVKYRDKAIIIGMRNDLDALEELKRKLKDSDVSKLHEDNATVETSIDSDSFCLSTPNTQSTLRKRLHKELMELYSQSAAQSVPDEILTSDIYFRILQNIRNKTCIEDQMFDELKGIVLSVSPQFVNNLMILTKGKLTTEELHLSLLIKCGIRSTDLTVLFGLSNGAIISRKRILGSKALDRQESTKVITSIIRLL